MDLFSRVRAPVAPGVDLAGIMRGTGSQDKQRVQEGAITAAFYYVQRAAFWKR